MENPQIRPGRVESESHPPTVVAFFRNSAAGNLAIQLLTAIGVPAGRLAVTPPEQIEHGQGMLLSIGCPTEALVPKVEDVCRKLGAELHRAPR